MEILVIQHIKIEDPGYIKDLMIKDGVNITTIELDEGEKIPKNLKYGMEIIWQTNQQIWVVKNNTYVIQLIIQL